MGESAIRWTLKRFIIMQLQEYELLSRSEIIDKCSDLASEPTIQAAIKDLLSNKKIKEIDQPREKGSSGGRPPKYYSLNDTCGTTRFSTEGNKKRLVQEKGGSFLNFFTPAIVAALYVPIQLLIQFFVTIVLSLVQLTSDPVINTLLIIFVSQMIGAAMIYFAIIPLFKVRNVDFGAISKASSFKTLAIYCLLWLFLVPSYVGYFLLSNILEMETTSSYNSLLLTADQAGILFNLVVFLAALTIGPALFEEYLFRRTLIPLLEERGMSPVAAVLASSLAFALVHVPNDLINGSVIYAAEHFWSVIVLGMACGIAYVVTRNVIFSVLIHCFGNMTSLVANLLLVMENGTLLTALGLLTLTLIITGLAVAVHALWKLFRPPTRSGWLLTLKEKSSVRIRSGLIGFLVVFSGVIFYMSVLTLNLSRAPIILTPAFHGGLVIFWVLFLRYQTVFDSKSSNNPEINQTLG
ncbi:MAG: type II CAAX prenyl endopeptidase Rce1 family protein [Candidatus Odinarchaeota archaeon]